MVFRFLFPKFDSGTVEEPRKGYFMLHWSGEHLMGMTDLDSMQL